MRSKGPVCEMGKKRLADFRVPFIWWGVEWERNLVVWVRFCSGFCLVCKERVRVLFGSFKNEGSSSVRVRF